MKIGLLKKGKKYSKHQFSGATLVVYRNVTSNSTTSESEAPILEVDLGETLAKPVQLEPLLLPTTPFTRAGSRESWEARWGPNEIATINEQFLLHSGKLVQQWKLMHVWWHLPGKTNGQRRSFMAMLTVSLPEGRSWFPCFNCFAFSSQSLGHLLQFHKHMFYSWGAAKVQTRRIVY